MLTGILLPHNWLLFRLVDYIVGKPFEEPGIFAFVHRSEERGWCPATWMDQRAVGDLGGDIISCEAVCFTGLGLLINQGITDK